MPILQTLQHKASRSRLRKLSNKSQGGSDATAVVVPRTAPSSGNAERTDLNDSTPRSEVLLPELSNSPNPNGGSLKFWRKRAPSPSPEMTPSPLLPSLDRQKSTKSILRRRPSSRSGSDDEHEVAKVTFGGNGARFQRSNTQGYNPPPSAFTVTSRRPDSTASSSSGAPVPPLPCPSPSLSARDGRSPGQRSSSLPPSPAHGRSYSPASGSYFPPATQSKPNDALSPTTAMPSTPMSQSRASSINSRSSNTNTPSGSSTPSSYMSASSGASSRLSTISTATAVSPGRAFPRAVPESPADAACRPYTPSGPAPYAAPRSLTYRSSRPTSSAGASIASTIRAPVQQQSRPTSAMSNASSSRRRVSSRPSTRSTRSTRASIASISTFTSSSSHGHSSGGPASPAGMSPISPNNGYTGAHGYASYTSPSSSHSGHSPVYNGTQAFVFPPAQTWNRTSITPTPSTPPGKRTSLIPPGFGGAPSFGDEVPMFNVIPATPGAAEEDAVVEPQPMRRSSSSLRRRSSSMERTLEVMPEEDEQVDDGGEEERHTARKLNFDLDEFSARSPRLNDIIGSPIQLNTLSLDDVSSDAESDETEVRTAEEPTQTTDDAFLGASLEDSFSSAMQSVPAPPPRFPKSPKRLTQSLYQAHDDGRSISHSLAELAALACDLPPLGEDMAMAANAAAERLARARATVDVSEPSFDFSSPRPLSAAPVMMGNYRPPVRKAASASPPNRAQPEEAERRRKTMAAPPRGPLPPTPPTPPDFSSYSSLPSLVSHGSMPSSASGCTTSSWNSQNSMSSSPESDHKLDLLFDSLTIGKDNMADLPDNPGLGLGFGLGLDVGFMGEKAKASPSKSNPSPMIAVSSADDDLPSDNVRIRPHRMSAMAAHPHRVALYGTPQLGRIRERDSYCSVASTVRHTPHGSVSSLSMMSEMSDDEALNAQVVDITTFAHPYVVGRENARAHEVGVAF